MYKIKSIEDVARRILALKALLLRTDAEELVLKDKGSAHSTDHIKETERLNNWIFSEDIYNYLSPKEKEAVAKSAGSWDKKTFINASWRTEALSVILWAAGLEDNIYSYDTQVDANRVREKITPYDNLGFLIKSIKMHEDNDILTQRYVAELWHWRARTAKIIKLNMIPSGYTIDKLLTDCKNTSQKAFEDGVLPTPIGGDFPAFGKPYKDLNDSELSVCNSIAKERHFGLNWISISPNEWDNTPTGT